jgi:hypothetical protein
LGLRESAGPAVLAPRSLVATDAVSLAALRRQLGRHADLVPSDWSGAGRHIVVVLVPGADGGGPVMVTSLEEEGVEVLILALAAREPGPAATGGFAIALAIPEPAVPVAIVLRWPAARGETTVVVLPEQPPAVRSAAGR